MTADLSFQICKCEDIVKIPKAAIRFLPTDKKYVREEDHHLLEIGGADSEEDSDDEDSEEENADEADSESKPEIELPEEDKDAEEDADKKKDKKLRHVWVQEGELLKAIETVSYTHLTLPTKRIV